MAYSSPYLPAAVPRALPQNPTRPTWLLAVLAIQMASVTARWQDTGSTINGSSSLWSARGLYEQHRRSQAGSGSAQRPSLPESSSGGALDSSAQGRGEAMNNDTAGGPHGGGARGTHAELVKDRVSIWPYTCFMPKQQASSPMLTIVTIIGNVPRSYKDKVTQNRLEYAAVHGYRYCELQTFDAHKIPAFAKLPWMLALMPCSEFLFHADADAMFVNLDLPLTPWVTFMSTQGIDQLFSKDHVSVTESPINYGVFMLRSASWIHDFFRTVFNKCACDWGRMHDWPAEQGIVYDLLAENMDSFETTRSSILPCDRWNHIIYDNVSLPNDDDVLIHLTNPCYFEPGGKCWEAAQKGERNTKECKYEGLEFFYDKHVATRHKRMSHDMRPYFVEQPNSCQQVRRNSLFTAKTTYADKTTGDAMFGAIPASVMDFDVEPNSGVITGIKVSEVACVGYRDFATCTLPRQWDGKQGRGPWMPWVT